MLTKFAITNFRGFSNRIEWDLSNPSNYEFHKDIISNGIIKNGIIYGPNGSGKTNLSLAIFDIVNHLSSKFKRTNYYDNFVYAWEKNGIVIFEYTFKFGKYILEYAYSKNISGVLVNESLKVNAKTIFAKAGSSLDIDLNEFPIKENIIKNLEKNANNISIANFLLISFPLKKDHYLIKLNQFVNSMLWFRSLDVREFIGLDTMVTNIEEFIIKNNLIDDFSDFLQKVSGQNFEFAKNNPMEKQLLCKIGGSRILFNNIASTGTHSLELLYYWIKRMDEASFVFIDEFDAFYHYNLSYEICKRLFAKKCQLFTSTHNTHLMTNDLLRPDCYFILDKGKIKPLNQCTEKELREAHNIEKIYKAGGFYVE